jgi:hypothetical protein
MASKGKPVKRESLTLLSLISFIISFAIARIFTTLHRGIILKIAGFHVHHFYYGAILMTIGACIGLVYKQERIARPAVVLIGAGGGLIGDEAGLILTGNYWTGVTYTIVIFFLAFVSAAFLIKRYSKTIEAEIEGFTISRAAFYFGIILAVVSIAFLTTRNPLISRISVITTIAACTIIIVHIALQIRTKQRSNTQNNVR